MAVLNTGVATGTIFTLPVMKPDTRVPPRVETCHLALYATSFFDVISSKVLPGFTCPWEFAVPSLTFTSGGVFFNS